MMNNSKSRFKIWAINQYDKILLFLLPLIITCINPNWIYNPPVLNTVDTWIYTGLFRNFFDLAGQYPSNTHYFIERLTIILPGYFLYHIFPVEIANAILHLGVYWVTIFALYGVAYRLFNRESAFLSMLCLGTYTWFLRAAGHDYIDGFGIAYFSLSLWFVTQAVYKPAVYKKNLFFAGISLAAMIVSQAFLGIFALLVGLYYLVMNLKNYRNNLIMSFVHTLFGALLLLGILMLLNFIWFGQPNIFANTLDFIRLTPSISTLRSSIYKFYGGLPNTWIVLPCVLALCAVGWLLRSHTLMTSQRFILRVVIAMFILIYSIFIFMHYTTNFAYLIIYLYMSFLTPSMFLLFAAGLTYISPQLTFKSSLYYTGLVLLPFVLITIIPSLQSILSNNQSVWTITGVMIVVFIVSLSRSYTLIYVILAFSTLNLAYMGQAGIAYYDRLDTYRTFMTAHHTLDQIDGYLKDYPDIKQFVVFERASNFTKYTMPLRGMSQPIHNHSFTFPSDSNTILNLMGYQTNHQVVLLLSEDESDIEKLRDIVGDGIEVKVLFSIPIAIDGLANAYYAHMLVMTNIDHYGRGIFPNKGKNIHSPSVIMSPPRAITWTGPEENIVLRFNLPSAKSDLIIQFCALTSTLELDETLHAQVNQTQVVFIRSEGDEFCPIRYLAGTPKEAIPGGSVTEIRMIIPVGWRSDDLVAGEAGWYGMALADFAFFEQP
jgi:hypothetical protein